MASYAGTPLDDGAGSPIGLTGRSGAATARRIVRDALRDEVRDEVVRDVELMVSELVGNAVVHGRTRCILQLSRPCDGVVRVAVTDLNLEAPRLGPADTSAGSGRGLQLIDMLALQWGHDRNPGIGNTVWFEAAI